MSDYNIPVDCAYTREDEWVLSDGDRTLIGITDYAQQQLGDIVFVELPAPGSAVDEGEPFGVIESVKAVADLYAPLSGTVIEANAELTEHPELLNSDCHGDGWLIAVEPSDSDEGEDLMSATEYAQYLAERSE